MGMFDSCESVFRLWVYFGAFAAFLFSLLQAVKKSSHKWMIMALVFTSSTIQLRYGFYLDGYLPVKPGLFFLFPTSILCVGPLMMKVGFRITNPDAAKKFHLLRHLIPAAIVLAMELGVLLFGGSQKLGGMFQLAERESSVVRNGVVLLGVHFGVYTFWLIQYFFSIRRQYQLPVTRMVQVMVFMPAISNLLITLGFAFKQEPMFQLGVGLISLNFFLMFFFQSIHPRFFHQVLTEINEQKYRSTPIDSLNIEQVQRNLRQLFTVEKIYTDAELRSEDLAARLEVSKHQLSRILNEHYGKNFNEFVNEYRIDEAKNLLVSKPQWNILEVAYSAGFNSKSTFNERFQKSVGMTPTAFRNTRLGR